MTDKRGVHPDCRNASNPYHECSEYCFQIIAEAKARMEQRGPALVQAGGRISQSSSGAQEQDEDLHDDRQDSDDHADGDREYPVVESVDVTNLTGRKKKLWELRNMMMKAKGDNQKEIAAEKKRMEAPTESRGISKQKWLDDRKKKIGKLLDANGLDMTKAYMLDTQESAEGKYKKWEKDPAPYGWDGMATMNQNKGKEVVDEVAGQGVQSQARPSAGDKRKALSKAIDLGKLPSRRKEKRVKHGPSKTGVVQSGSAPPLQQTPVHIHDIKDEFIDPPSRHTPSTIQMPVSPQPSSRVPLTLLEDEDLAWGRFERVVTDQDVAACYNMSLKDFEHSGVHDLFKAMSKFIAASRQATELDKTRISLERRVQEVKDESKRWAGVAGKAKDELKELKNHVEELKTDIIEKDTRLDHLQKKNDELSALLKEAKRDAVAEFMASKEYTDSLDTNYAAGFEDFRMDVMEHFPNLDFSSIKLNLGGAASSSLLQTSSEDVNIEDDATTLPAQDGPSADPPQ